MADGKNRALIMVWDMTPRFVVIGAGVSGMSAALLLARHGYAVTLVEKFPLPAPTLRGFFRQGAYFETTDRKSVV